MGEGETERETDVGRGRKAGGQTLVGRGRETNEETEVGRDRKTERQSLVEGVRQTDLTFAFIDRHIEAETHT